MLEVEDWTQAGQTNKRRPAPRKVSALSDPETERNTTSDPPEPPPSKPPAPPQSEFENIFNDTQAPTSSSFPARARANSTPVAGPSSLSRLLAQAPPEQLDTIAPSRDTSPPPTSPPPPPAPSSPSTQHVDSNSQLPGSLPHAPHVSSPLRPGSRGSRASSSSRFSVARLPRLASVTTAQPIVKAVPTTATAEHSLSSSPREFGATGASTSSQDSVFEGKSVIHQRLRTTSHHVPRPSPLAGDNLPTTPTSTTSTLANYFAVPFGRRKKVEMPVPVVETVDQSGVSEVSARDMLRRF